MAPGPQTRLMQGIAHGWKPTSLGHKAPSVAVAKEFVAAGTRRTPRAEMRARALEGGK